MMNYGDRKKLIISILFLLIISIGVGYAAISSSLSIAGNTEIASNTWDIHFANLNVTNGSVEATNPASIDINDNTNITYTVKLNRPKDFYEFTVDVVNSGTLPAKVSISSLSGITSEAEDIVDYNVTYTNGNPVNVGDILNAGATKHIRVRVFYIDDITEDDLPDSNISLILTYTLNYVQSEEDLFDTNALIQQLKTENSSCFTKYTGQVTDQPGQTVTANNVYFNNCSDKRNIIFNNMCWQMIRTTETGGVKMVYNGDVVDGKCLSTRSDKVGVYQPDNASQISLNSNYLYGDSFTYDITNNTFTLINTFSETWSDSTYENLLGKFTCMNLTGTCTSLYSVNTYESNTNATVAGYILQNNNFAQIADISFSARLTSPAMLGYMFNKIHSFGRKSPGATTYKYGNTYTYNNGIYTLSGTTQVMGSGQSITSWSSGNNKLSNTHYTCWNAEGTCSTLSYIYYTTSSYAFYYDLTDGEDIDDILEDMLSSNDVNKYNSSIKALIDSWYIHNLSEYTQYLEDTVYCNARNITDLAGFNPNGGDTVQTQVQFKNATPNSDLSCLNETDQFAVSNNKAKLTYPIALISSEEWNNIGSDTLRRTGMWYYTLSPMESYYSGYTMFAAILEEGYWGDDNAYPTMGVRPAISLNNDVKIASGSGSEADPWVVE